MDMTVKTLSDVHLTRIGFVLLVLVLVTHSELI